jgi:rubredoxin
MIVNMACPKCGGQATEYDENKWSCLRCGNKFIFAPEQPRQTIVQSNVHIQGQGNFDLDTANARPPAPRIIKMIEHDPGYFSKRIAINTTKITALQNELPWKVTKKNIALPIFLVMLIGWGIVLSLVLWTALFVKPRPDGDVVEQIVIFLFLIGLPALISFFIYRPLHNRVRELKSQLKELQQSNLSMGQENSRDTKIGDYIVCPHCAAPSDYVALKSPPPAEGLRHCLKCGQQFFTSGLNSYPVLFKK